MHCLWLRLVNCDVKSRALENHGHSRRERLYATPTTSRPEITLAQKFYENQPRSDVDNATRDSSSSSPIPTALHLLIQHSAFGPAQRKRAIGAQHRRHGHELSHPPRHPYRYRSKQRRESTIQPCRPLTRPSTSPNSSSSSSSAASPCDTSSSRPLPRCPGAVPRPPAPPVKQMSSECSRCSRRSPAGTSCGICSAMGGIWWLQQRGY